MNILVIGGTYFLGKAFVEAIAGKAKVSVLNRGNRPLALPEGAEITEYHVDRHDRKKLEAMNLPEFDVVVDFCAYTKGDISDILKILGSRIKQYIFVSTCDVYPHVSGRVYDEESDFETMEFGGEAGDYITGKVALERELRSLCGALGISYTSIRPTFIYGPDNYAPREGIYFNWIKKSNQILMPADSDGHFQMVYVKDVAAVIAAACGNFRAYNKAFNVTGTTTNYGNFADCLEKATGAKFERASLSVAEIMKRAIPLPFPMREEESFMYDGSRVIELGVHYTSLTEGLRETYRRYCQDYSANLFAEIDRLFEENRAKKAESYMLTELECAENCNDQDTQLQLLNELIGYYRQISDENNILKIAAKSEELVNRMGLEGTIPYATTMLNIANSYRSIGHNEESLKYYRMTERVYKAQLAPDDMLFAGFLNNMSLLYQELNKPEQAMDYQMRALEIAQKNDAGFEIAVSLSNIANTYVQLEQYDKAVQYGEQAIQAFRERNFFDAHYCAALSALGMCKYHEGDYAEAEALFEEGMRIIEGTLGQNAQYRKLQTNRDMCRGFHRKPAAEKQVKKVRGLDICRAFYEECGKPMLEKNFPDYIDRIAVGLVGEGSDCYGFDDEISRDHDWGPGFCMWVSEETYEAIGADLQKAYEALPDTFHGFGRTESERGGGRRGVMVINDFYRRTLGTAVYEEINWNLIEDYALAVVCNGEVFADPEGTFSEMRAKLLTGYPERIQFLKIAEDAARFSQYGQYNNLRMSKREDKFTSCLMTAQACVAAMKLWHHVNNAFPPHDKWLKASTLRLPYGDEVMELLEKFLSAAHEPALLKGYGEQLGELFAGEMYAKNIISDVESYLDVHTEELLEKAGFASLSHEELVDEIVKLEFDAFDKVKNEGGRAYCQNDWPTFSVMRKSQYLTWDRDMLMQYFYDFRREYKKGHNLITEKYGRMMESTAPERYAELAPYFPELSEQKKAVIEQIVGIQMAMVEEFAREYPKAAGNARSLHTYEDNIVNTSYETYLRGEISTYSDKMLQLYGRYVADFASAGRNIARETIQNTVNLYGYKSIAELEGTL